MWWTVGDSNSLPQQCECCALPDELRAHTPTNRRAPASIDTFQLSPSIRLLRKPVHSTLATNPTTYLGNNMEKIGILLDAEAVTVVVNRKNKRF